MTTTQKNASQMTDDHLDEAAGGMLSVNTNVSSFSHHANVDHIWAPWARTPANAPSMDLHFNRSSFWIAENACKV